MISFIMGFAVLGAAVSVIFGVWVEVDYARHQSRIYYTMDWNTGTGDPFWTSEMEAAEERKRGNRLLEHIKETEPRRPKYLTGTLRREP